MSSSAVCAADNVTLNNPFVALVSGDKREEEKEAEEEEEEDKENMSPMVDLSVSADGSALLAVEHMDVGLAGDEEEIDDAEGECRR